MTNDSLLIGAHQSIAGGVHNAFERGRSVGCKTLQVFTKNNNQWYAKPLTAEDISNYKTAESKSRITPVIAHAGYLINLSATNKTTLRKSRESFADELRRCDLLGIHHLIVHPGAHVGAGETDGIQRIIESLNQIHVETKNIRTLTVLETTAGQGTAIGYRFEHLLQIIENIEMPQRTAICIDTCHVFAAGYNISNEAGYERTIKEFDETIGLHRLAVIHTNDSKKQLGSRVDRHEHIGKGAIGKTGFRCLMQDKRLKHIPKILETPKGEDLKEDKMNIRVLRRLAGENK